MTVREVLEALAKARPDAIVKFYNECDHSCREIRHVEACNQLVILLVTVPAPLPPSADDKRKGKRK